MCARGTYGRTVVGADPYGRSGPSWGTMLLGGLVVGVSVLWAKHQSDQIERLYATAGLPYQGFARSLGARTRGLSRTARAKLSQHLEARKELDDGT